MLLGPNEKYRYGRNSPLWYRDPSGLQAAVAAGGVVVLETVIIGGFVVLTLNGVSPLQPPTFPAYPPSGAYPPFKPPKPTPNPQDYNAPLPKACDYPQLPGKQVQPPNMPKDQCVALCAAAAFAPPGATKKKAMIACILCVWQSISGTGDPNSYKPPNGPWNKP